MPQLTLNNGVKMPVLGFGVYQIPAEQTEQVVSDATFQGGGPGISPLLALRTRSRSCKCSR